MFDYRALYEIQLQVSVDFLRVVQLSEPFRSRYAHIEGLSRITVDGVLFYLFILGGLTARQDFFTRFEPSQS